MAAAVVGGVDEDFGKSVGHVGRLVFAAEADDVCVIVMAAEFGGVVAADDGGADAVELVGADGDTHACGAHEDTEVGFFVNDVFGDEGGVVGVVNGV